MDRTTERAVKLLSEVVKIPSVNPFHVGATSGDGAETEMTSWLANRADDAGADVEVDPVQGKRSNVYATFAGEGEGSIVVDVHLDTVGVENMTDDPFDGRVTEGRVYGRGAVDTKASAVIILALIEEMMAQGRRPSATVTLLGTVGEEAGGMIGAAQFRTWLLANRGPVDRLIVAEPTMCAPVYGHKGGCGLDVVINGRSAHSSQVELGVNAVSAAARVISAIDEHQRELASARATTPIGTGSVAVTTIDGGRAQNVIPDQCLLHLNRRISPDEAVSQEIDSLTAIIHEAAQPATAEVTVAQGFAVDAFHQPDSQLIADLGSLANSEPTVASFGSNAFHYGELAEETVIFGPGSIDQAHGAVEWIDIHEIDRAINVYRQLLSA